LKIQEPFKLPCGVELPNRIAKAAMTERLSRKNNHANEMHETLYEKWGSSGTGLLISGNVVVDKRYKEAGGNIVIEDESGIEPLKKMATAVTKNGSQFWMQISHAGRQATIFSTFRPIAPSSVQLKKMLLFAPPREMSETDIEDVISRFVNTAKIAQKAGFTGIQIHSAHGYLLSQFLAPKTNQRTDKWGGSIENRARLLFAIYEKTRAAVGNDFPIGVKLNSADFQRGGFNEEDGLFVVKQLEKMGVDLLEISGGTYENIDFLLSKLKPSTQRREAYFMDFATLIRKECNIPLMVTGGFRSSAFCEEVLENNEIDIIGFARPYLIDEHFPATFLKSGSAKIVDVNKLTGIKQLEDFSEAGFYDYQIRQLATNKPLNMKISPFKSVVWLVKNEMAKGWF